MVKHLVNFLYIIIYFAPFTIIRYYPFRKKLRLPISIMLLIYAVIISAQAILFCVLADKPDWTLELTQIYRMGFLGFYVLLSLCLVRDNIFRQLYVWSLTVAFAGVIFAIGNFTEARFFPAIAETLPHAVTVAVVSVLLITLFPLLLRLMERVSNLTIPSDNEKVWGIIWLAPILVDFGTLLSTWSLAANEGSTFAYLFIRLFCFGSMVGFSLVLSETLRQIVKNTSLTERSRMMDAQIALQEDAYHKLETQIRETKAARHDLRHHLTLVHSYLRAQEFQSLQEYLTEYIRSLPEERELLLCQNHAVNVITAHYVERARAAGIAVNVSLHVPQDIGICDTDLSILFGNCLENALEACGRITEGDPYIRIASEYHGKMLIVLFENSFNGVVTYDGTEFRSSKRDGHGIGISSAKAIVSQYRGIAKFEPTDFVFRVSIMMQARDDE